MLFVGTNRDSLLSGKDRNAVPDLVGGRDLGLGELAVTTVLEYKTVGNVDVPLDIKDLPRRMEKLDGLRAEIRVALAVQASKLPEMEPLVASLEMLGMFEVALPPTVNDHATPMVLRNGKDVRHVHDLRARFDVQSLMHDDRGLQMAEPQSMAPNAADRTHLSRNATVAAALRTKSSDEVAEITEGDDETDFDFDDPVVDEVRHASYFQSPAQPRTNTNRLPNAADAFRRMGPSELATRIAELTREAKGLLYSPAAMMNSHDGYVRVDRCVRC
jgi:hypothetical protein